MACNIAKILAIVQSNNFRNHQPLSIQHTQMDIGALKAYFLDLQDRITSATSALDGKVFVADEWHKPEDSKLKGYGRTCISVSYTHLTLPTKRIV